MSMERRIGVLLPSSNMVIEPEFYRAIPPGITGASFAKPGYDREIVARIHQATGLRSTTTSTAVLEAFPGRDGNFV